MVKVEAEGKDGPAPGCLGFPLVIQGPPTKYIADKTGVRNRGNRSDLQVRNPPQFFLRRQNENS